MSNIVIINATPHDIKLNNGKIFETSGIIARVSSELVETDEIDGVPVFSQNFGEITGLPEEKFGTIYIVSAMVLAASNRNDLIAPATSHKDVVRNENGQIISVPGFVK